MRAWRRSLAAAGAALALAACTGGPSDGQSDAPSRVRIGLLAPLSGPGSAPGREALRGAQLAAELVNQSSNLPLPPAAGVGLPGLRGAALQVDSADTRGDPEGAANQAIRLVGQRVAGLVSVGDTQATALASERTERVGVPFVDAGATANYLSERGMDWYFRIGPNDRILGERLLSMLQQTGTKTARTLAIVHSHDSAGDSAGTDMSVALQGLAGEGGYQVVANVVLPTPPGSANAVVDQLRAAAPDAVIAATSRPADSSALLASFQALGWHPKVTMAMGAGFTLRPNPPALSADPDGVLLSDAWSAEVAERNPVARQVAELYERRFGGPMTEASAKGFTAALILAQGIDAAGSTEAGRVRAALQALDIPGRDTIMPWDGVRFDQAGQNTRAAAVVERLTSGGVRTVFPPELAPRA